MANAVPRRGAVKPKTPERYARPSAHARGYGKRWQATSKGYLANHPLCVHCEANGHVEQATEVDHIVPHKGDMSLFWDSDNWQGLCKRCHSRKTAQGL